jgi:hypothetical protein
VFGIQSLNNGRRNFMSADINLFLFTEKRMIVFGVGHSDSVAETDVLQIVLDGDFSCNYFLKDFALLSGKHVVHLVEVESGEDCLVWVERITSISYAEAKAL